MRRLLLCLVLPLLVACGDSPAPIPTPSPPAPESAVLLSIQTLLQNPGEWSGRPMTLIAAIEKPDSQLLIQGTDPGGKAIADDAAGAVWLADPLPGKTAALLVPGVNYLKLRGRLSPPGGYGTDGRYLYQFSAETVSVITPELSTVANIADNTRSMDGVVLKFEGILLIGGEATLVVDRISEGGVPPANAKQVKIRDLTPAQIPATLQQQGVVRFGPVTITGWMKDGVLRPFAVSG